MSLQIPFYKYQGTGNDFIFLSEKDIDPSWNLFEIARTFCNRSHSIGADGLVILNLINQETVPRWRWNFLNRDGSQAEMCGNAARCVVTHSWLKTGSSQCELETLAGVIKGKMQALPCVSLPKPKDSPVEISLENYKDIVEVKGFSVNTGVPHFVLFENLLNLSTTEPFTLCKWIQEHPIFAPKETNVTVVSETQKEISVKTFERGVKSFTMACGTGAMAAALSMNKINSTQKSFNFKFPGGPLNVTLLKDEIELSGPAEQVYSGILNFKP